MFPRFLGRGRSNDLVFSLTMARSPCMVFSLFMARSHFMVFFSKMARSLHMVFSQVMARSLIMVFSGFMAHYLNACALNTPPDSLVLRVILLLFSMQHINLLRTFLSYSVLPLCPCDPC